MFKPSKKIAILGIASVLVVGVSTAAFAYWTTNGTGTGTATHATPTSVTFTQDTVIDDLSPGNMTPSTILGHVSAFTGGTRAYISTIVPTLTVTETSAAIAAWGDPADPLVPGTLGLYHCSAADYTLTNGVYDTEAVQGGTGTTASSVPLGTIVFEDLATNQDACKGATVNLTFTASEL
jgi:hypothetical protein